MLWELFYLGYDDRVGPDGTIHPGVKTKQAALEILKQKIKQISKDKPLIGWCYDPVLLSDNSDFLRQIQKVKELGIGVNLFINHIHDWGDFHYEHSLGPTKSQFLDPTKTIMDHGIVTGFHADGMVTRTDPLFSVQNALLRRTRLGRVLGEKEKLDRYRALQAITIHSADLLNYAEEIGSIERAKRADFFS